MSTDKVNNFKGFKGFTAIKVGKREFNFATSSLPMVSVALRVVTDSALPCPPGKVARHKEAKKAAKLCGVRDGNPTHKLASDSLEALKNQGVVEKANKFGFAALNKKLVKSFQAKLDKEIVKLSAEVKDTTKAKAKKAGKASGRVCGTCKKTGHNARTCGRPVVVKPKGKRGRPVGSKNKPTIKLEQLADFLNEKGIDLDQLAKLCAVADKVVDFFNDVEVIEPVDTSDTDALIDGLVADIKEKHAANG
tara:strand:+ start:11758 stop:12504 length:747 start_codon:yes stop_codon:yes gene_type:complete